MATQLSQKGEPFASGALPVVAGMGHGGITEHYHSNLSQYFIVKRKIPSLNKEGGASLPTPRGRKPGGGKHKLVLFHIDDMAASLW